MNRRPSRKPAPPGAAVKPSPAAVTATGTTRPVSARRMHPGLARHPARIWPD
ncbi:MAG: hypothetical protein NTZ11_03885 [Gammaproteobacteria bacterium]|nr:hypothetical protein [Gammaproteobacteria bacterium]